MKNTPTSDLLDDKEKVVIEYTEAVTYSDQQVTDELIKLDVMNAWNRYQHLQFWWMHSITARSLQSLKPNVDMFWKKCEPYYREPRISLLRFPKTTWQKLLNTLVT